jgi:PPOX class probable F420-dependent enzyme
MATPLSEKTKQLLDDRNVVVITTISADGSPHASIVWATHDGTNILLSSREGNMKVRNLQRDPRASAVVLDRDDPYSYVEVRGIATIATSGGEDLVQALSQHYIGLPHTRDQGTDAVRVVIRISPTRVRDYKDTPYPEGYQLG